MVIKHRKINITPDFQELLTPEAVDIIEAKIANVADEYWYENANDAQNISDLFNIAREPAGSSFWIGIHCMCVVLPLEEDDAKNHALAAIDAEIAKLKERKTELNKPKVEKDKD